jgi:2-polyprenyl-3-methyl-5-hydroxy-6-metoxy-1,4-benzoquinol methylase
MDNVLLGDAQHLEDLEVGNFDVVVAGELLEHLPCPRAFLTSARPLLNPRGIIIVTTCNAFCLRRFLRIPFGRENVHVDHVVYFSHRTLQRLAEISGYEVTEQCAYRIPNKAPLFPYVVERLASIISPNLCEGIICTMTPAL